MSSTIEITSQQLARRIGLPDAPVIIDVCIPADIAADPRRIPGSHHRAYETVASWAHGYRDQKVIVVCHRGLKLSHGVAAWLRHEGIEAESLTGGIQAWRDVGLPTLNPALLPKPDAQGRTVWVTRARPKVDRIACPWLIKRFVDPAAVFLFVAASEVLAVAERFGATPFDIDDVFWSHRGETCTFDTMIAEFGLKSAALDQLATIVRGADTARLDLAPEAAGFLAISLGLSRMYRDDLAQLDAGLVVYDALYRWCRDATDETHNWPSPSAKTASGKTS